MKVKRQKQNRRYVRFYRTCFGFHEPFKVLCDGNFIAQMQRMSKENIEDSLSKLLAGSVRPLATRCVTTELRKLGQAFAGAARASRNLTLAMCTHEHEVAAAECIREMIGTQNPEHFFVATQDVELRRHLRKIPGVALIFARETALVLEPPSEAQQQHARDSEAQRTGVSATEKGILRGAGAATLGGLHSNLVLQGARENANLPKEQVDALAGGYRAEGPSSTGHLLQAALADDEGRSEQKKKLLLSQRDRAEFKRKRVKGPNPLSNMKKKRGSTQAPAVSLTKEEDKSEDKKPRTRRKRRKSSTQESN